MTSWSLHKWWIENFSQWWQASQRNDGTSETDSNLEIEAQNPRIHETRMKIICYLFWWNLLTKYGFSNNIVIDFSFQQEGTTQLWVRARLAKLCPINTLCGIVVRFTLLKCVRFELYGSALRSRWRENGAVPRFDGWGCVGGQAMAIQGGLGVPGGVSLRRSLSPRCVLALMIRVFTLRNRDPGPLLRLTQWWVLVGSNQDEERQTTRGLFNWEERLVFNCCRCC